MKVLLKLVLSSFLFVAVNASAESYTLRNNNTGSVFTCSAGGATTPVNPQCISELNDYCDYETNYSFTDILHLIIYRENSMFSL